MKMFKALGSGFGRSLKAWMGILVLWLGSLLTVSLIAIPVRGFIGAGLGRSMITERLQDGINFEVLGDLGNGFRSLLAAFPGSLFLLILIGILLNAFLTGGLFDSLKGSSSGLSGNDFFKACSRNFWSFLVISLVITIIIILLGLLIIVLPVSIVIAGNPGSETAPFLTVIFSISFFILVTLIFLLVADYARAWQAARERQSCLKAIGFGFSRTFRRLLSSYPMMLLLVASQAIFTLLVIKAVGNWQPDTRGGVFLLFLVSQILFILKILLRTWRYGSVTSLMELADKQTQQSNIPVQ